MNKRSFFIAISMGIIIFLIALWIINFHNNILNTIGVLLIVFGSGLLAVVIYSAVQGWIIVKPKQAAMIGALSGFIEVIISIFYHYHTLTSSDIIIKLCLAIFSAGTNAITGLIGSLLIGRILGSKAPKQKLPKEGDQEPDLSSENYTGKKLFFSKSLGYGWSRFKRNFIFWMFISILNILLLFLSFLIFIWAGYSTKPNLNTYILAPMFFSLLYIFVTFIPAQLAILEAHGYKAKFKHISLNIFTITKLFIYLLIVSLLSTLFGLLEILIFVIIPTAGHHAVLPDFILGIIFYVFVCRFFFGYYLIIDQVCSPFTALVKGWKMSEGLGLVTPIFFLFLLIINILAAVPYGFGLLISVGWTSIATGYFYMSALPSDKRLGKEVEQQVGSGKSAANQKVVKEFQPIQTKTKLSATNLGEAKQEHTIMKETIAAQSQDQAWILHNWKKPDLSYALNYAQNNSRNWSYYTPYLELVPCNGGLKKPAIFIKVGMDYSIWSKSVELRSIAWNNISKNNHVLLSLSTYFEDPHGNLIGNQVPGSVIFATFDFIAKSGNKLVCHNYYNPMFQETYLLVHKFVTHPGPTVIFFVQDNCENINHIFYHFSEEYKLPAIEILDQAKATISEQGWSNSDFQSISQSMGASSERWNM